MGDSLAEPKVDLHTHSIFSDGKLTPEQLLEEAQWAALSAIALTDHDNTDGLARAIAAGNERSIEVISGVELSCVHDNKEVHLLGLLIEPNEKMSVEMKKMRDNRESRMQLMLDKLEAMNIHITMDELPLSETNSLGRPHLARVMVKKGYVKNISEAFEHYIGDEGPGYVAKERWSISEGLELIHKAKGISFLAHPGASGLVDYIDEFVRLGMMGVEVYYAKHSPELEKRLVEKCAEQNLLVCGGSDYHSAEAGPSLGIPFISYDILKKIKKRKDELWPVS